MTQQQANYKWVKKANMYVKTWFEDGKQKQHWISQAEYEALT